MNVLSVKNISKTYSSDIRALSEVSFDLTAGKITGIAGPNGSGKSTLFKIITGVIKPDPGGEVSVCGHNIFAQRRKALELVGCCFDETESYKYLTGLENLEIHQRMYGPVDKKRIEHITEKVGLSDKISKKVKTYSFGMKHRLELAKALLTEPKVLVLDEPMNGLDPEGIKDFRKIISEYAQKGTGVIISTHVLHEINNICDEVIFLSKGRIADKKNVDKDLDIEKTFFEINDRA